MKVWKYGSIRLLPVIILSVLGTVILMCGLTRAPNVKSQAPSVTVVQGWPHFRLPNYRAGLPICEQAHNLVPNPGFEQALSHWTEGGKGCFFSVDQPGHDSTTAAMIAGSTKNKNCMLFSTIDEISVEPGRHYDYGVWINADLDQGNAYLAISFWRLHKRVWKSVGEPALTNLLTDTQGAWVQATGSVQAPPDAEYARIEATFGEQSAGSARFDDFFFGLATCLDVSKNDEPHYVTPGQTLTYTIAYSNTGREKATGVRIIETYDSDVDPILERTHPSPDIGNHTWEVGEVLSGGSGTITIVVQVDSDAEEPLFNSVELHSNEENPKYESIHTHTISSTCAVCLNPAARSKTGKPGETIPFTLESINTGSCDGQVVLTATSSLNWDFEFDPPTCTLPIDHSESMILYLGIPSTTTGGTEDVTSITATLACSQPYGFEYATAHEMVSTFVIGPVFLPMVLKDFYDTSIWESEPNDLCSYEDANGPLLPNIEYYGYTDDYWDWFRIETPQGQVAVEVTIYAGSGIQVLLANKNCQGEVRDFTPEDTPEGGHLYYVEHSGDPNQYNRYYFGIYTESDHDHSYDRPYVIWVTLS